jgi:NitT/TauT family transport system substrate-binding protein
MRINKRIVFAIVAVTVVIIGAAVLLWPRAPAGYTGKMESITIGTPLNESSTLIYIAAEQHFFAGNGLNVIIRDYDFGALALNSMLIGEVDIALATEFPLVIKALRKEKVHTIGSIGKFEFVYLIGRKDRGIEKISDLKGKRIATARQTIAEFHLGRYLNLHGISLEEITLIDLQKSEQLTDALVTGNTDAIVTQHPYVAAAEERLGANGVVWPVQSGQAMFSPIICRDEWITHHPELVTRLLKSLAQAEVYVVNHPVEAEAILQKRLNLKSSYVKTVRLRDQFSLSLDQSLIVAMEDEARWMIKNNLTGEKTIPDFTKYIYLDGLKAVRPEAVNIIH